MARCREENARQLLAFILNAPCHEDIEKMDCNDYCEQLAELAEQVASGEDLQKLLPRLEEHLDHWKDCREEFDALVAVIRAEAGGAVAVDPASRVES
jgi:hypothetical protein